MISCGHHLKLQALQALQGRILYSTAFSDLTFIIIIFYHVSIISIIYFAETSSDSWSPRQETQIALVQTEIEAILVHYHQTVGIFNPGPIDAAFDDVMAVVSH